MKKLLLVGSASVHVLNYYNLVRDYFDDVLIVSNENVYGSLPFKEINFSLRNPLRVFGNINKLKKIIADYKPSLIHIHQANSVAWITFKAAAGKKIPVVLTAWGDDILVHPHQSFILKKMVQQNLASASALTSDSLYMAEKMQELILQKRIEIVCANFGIETPAVDISLKENIIYSNRLHKSMYRIDAIIKAFAAFHRTTTGSKWKLVIAGSGDETDNLKNLAEKLAIGEKVIFAGWLSPAENQEMYAKSKIYVSVPDSDATSISLLEALHAGCVPVVSDLPANHEWITDGLNGIIVKNLNSEFITPALQLDYDELVKFNRKLVDSKATRPANKAEFIKIYNRLLN